MTFVSLLNHLSVKKFQQLGFLDDQCETKELYLLGQNGNHEPHQALTQLQNLIFYQKLKAQLRHRGVVSTLSS